ncbi:MAG: LacI family DNA-binding transcriptional regulator, partial [Salana multivorans]|nr:LacI family DNA-binding transcriptional regulator [Salana multivorans]
MSLRDAREEAPRAVTMSDVARIAGVSLKTVSNVINDYPHVRPTTRARVTEAIEELGYRVNATARNLRRGRTGLVGLAIPDLGESYFGELANAVVDVADGMGLSVLIEPTRADAASELEVLTNDRRSMTDGLLFSPLLLEATDLRRAVAASPFPIVLLGERVFGVGIDHAVMANIEGTRAATAYLIERGARRIVAAGAPPVREPDPRLVDFAEDGLTRELTT